MINLPNSLTLLRIALVPFIVGLLFVPGDTARPVAALLFLLAAATDYADGFLARRLDQMTDLGRLLDPIADKILVGALLFALAGTGDLAGWALLPATVILCREIIVTGLREFMAERGLTLPSSRLAKWKTGAQLCAVALLIVAPFPFPPGVLAGVLAGVPAAGLALLWAAGILTAMTGADYLMACLRRAAR